MKFPTLSDINVKNKVVILRSDLNSPVKNGKVLDNPRFKASAITIKELKKKCAKVVILAHQSQKGKKDFISLDQHAKILSKYTKVKFVRDIIGKSAINSIKSLKSGEAVLLENIRFEKSEFSGPGKNSLIKALLPFIDFYVNDAFSVAHRKHTSIIGFPRYLPSAIGRQMEYELSHLEKINLKECLYILGGVKPEDTIDLANNKHVLVSGYLSHLVLKARGYKLGKQEDSLKQYSSLIPKLKKLEQVKTPIDIAFLDNKKRKEISIYDLPIDSDILDIGEKTIELYKKEIQKAKYIFMKGPLGYTEDARFCKGTYAILHEIAKSKAFSVLGGGHLSTAVEKAKINKSKFNYISLSGGALLEYIAGKRLPGLEALKNKRNLLRHTL